MSKPTLHLMLGLPGSGKTTLAKHIQAITKAVRLSSDDYRLLLFPEPTFSQKEHDNLYGMLDHNLGHLLESGHDVIYDANLNRSCHRQEKYVVADKHGANVVLWWIKTPPQLSKKRRIEDQDHVLIPDGESPQRMFERIESVFEAPGSDEPYREIDGSEISRKAVQGYLDSLN